LSLDKECISCTLGSPEMLVDAADCNERNLSIIELPIPEAFAITESFIASSFATASSLFMPFSASLDGMLTLPGTRFLKASG